MLEKIIEAPNIIEMIKVIGLIGVLLVVFAESGLFFGFFLPGDSLLFASGVLAALRVLPLWQLLVFVPCAAIVGDAAGYLFGRKAGDFLYQKKNSRFFKQEHLKKAEEFYQKHGPKAIVIARFVPIVRTFVPIVAGAAHMSYKTFAFYNICGGILWSTLLLLLGYTLGATVSHIDIYLFPIVCIIIFLSFMPVVKEFISSQKRNKKR